MARPPKISILLHERANRERYGLLMHIARVWQRMNIEVEVLSGVRGNASPTNLLIPHVNLTRRPPAYCDFVRRCPRALNRNIEDISKRIVSQNLVAAIDEYDGPVIVKTNLNYGGTNEAQLFEATASKVSWWIHRLRQKSYQRLNPRSGVDLKRITHLPSASYPVFASLREVPRGVWSNSNLVVERFIPERENGYYCLRVCLFFGHVALSRRIYSLEPIIKGSGMRSESADLPDQLIQYRQRMGFDYGKIDYVMHDGQMSVLDTNITPGGVQDDTLNARIAEQLAVGIDDYNV